MQIVLLAGLPRSGSTLLCGLLNQNPNIAVSEASTLLPLLNNIRTFWADSIRNKFNNKQHQLIPILKSVFDSYHDQNISINIDKHREWLFYIDLVNKIVDYPIKILCTVRNPLECAASFERLYQKEPETYTQWEEITEDKGFTVLNRAKSMLTYDGSIGKAYIAIKEASLIQNKRNQMLFIDYHKLCNNPQEQLSRISNFLEIKNFHNYDFNNIKNVIKQNDSSYRMYAATHEIESKVREGKRDLEKLNLFSNQFDLDEFWAEWT